METTGTYTEKKKITKNKTNMEDTNEGIVNVSMEENAEEPEGAFKKKCFNCGGRNVRLVLMLEGNRRTKNFTTSCSNSKCFRHWKLEEIPSWILA